MWFFRIHFIFYLIPQMTLSIDLTLLFSTKWVFLLLKLVLKYQCLQVNLFVCSSTRLSACFVVFLKGFSNAFDGELVGFIF